MFDVKQFPGIVGAEPEEISMNQIRRVEPPAQTFTKDFEFRVYLRATKLPEVRMQPPLPAMGKAGAIKFECPEQQRVGGHAGCCFTITAG